MQPTHPRISFDPKHLGLAIFDSAHLCSSPNWYFPRRHREMKVPLAASARPRERKWRVPANASSSLVHLLVPRQLPSPCSIFAFEQQFLRQLQRLISLLNGLNFLLSLFNCFLAQGVGKSTLIMRVFESLKTSNPNLKVQGFYTRKLLFFLSLVTF